MSCGMRCVWFALGVVLLASTIVSAQDVQAPPRRPGWTTSRVQGTPEPPPPLKAVRAFPKLTFKNPLLLARCPDSETVFGDKRLFVAEQAGKIWSFPQADGVEQADLFLDLTKAPLKPDVVSAPARMDAIYGLVFPPDLADSRICYVCYVVSGKDGAPSQLPDGSRVSRFKVEGTPPRAVPESEEVILTWLGGGHNGGDLHFGPDGCLYISTGDGSFPNPPDALLAGQDVSNLLSSILRIDVRRTQGDRKYTIPADNPFVNLDGARGEIWAYGFRNPWRMSFDPVTGDLWTGDVGWELYESVIRVEKAGNYGWSIMEGPQPVRLEGKPGPTPLLPPALAIPHSEGMSVTAGYVYRGSQFPELTGQYLFGDWETRRIWAAKWDGQQLVERQDLVEPTIRISAFGVDYDSEHLLLDYDDGTLHRFLRNPESGQPSKFPQTLSETGLFASVKDHAPAAGVEPFAVNAGMWSDHATAERFLALPDGTHVLWHDPAKPITGTMFSRTFEFPANGVLAKTLSLEMTAGDPSSRRRIETQILHYTGRVWRPYTYAWNEEQTDATLIPSEGQERTLSVIDANAPGGKRTQTWTYAGRAACQRCHNPWAGHMLAFNVPQLNGDVSAGHTQLDQLQSFGLLVRSAPEKANTEEKPLPRLVSPHATDNDLNTRARSYLHSNCAHCHRFGGGGTADIDLIFDTPLEKTKTLGTRPLQGTFGIHEAQIIARGDPYASVLYFRMSKIGRGRMPHIGSEIVDPMGMELIHDWIRQLPPQAELLALLERFKELDESRARKDDAEVRTRAIDRMAAELAQKAGRAEPSDEDRTLAGKQYDSQSKARVAKRDAERKSLVTKLIATPTGAMLVARAIDDGELSPELVELVLATGAAQTDLVIRDVFERFLPDELRSKRLGNVIRPEQILGMTGDATRGAELFARSTAVTCRNCHRVGDTGGKLGPELTQIAKKLTRPQLLESILEPSKTIEPKYIPHLVETVQGQVYTGLLQSQSKTDIVLRDVQDKEIRIIAADVEQMRPQRVSIMPDLLAKDLTAQQLADLLAYLEGLK